MIPYNIFQTAYVTPDIDAAVAVAAERFAAPRMQVNRDVGIETGSGVAHCHFALAFIGAVQLELIQPAGGADDVYRAMLPQTGLLRLHHIGCLVEMDVDWEALLAQIAAIGQAMPVRGAFADLMHYAYADHRDEIGHYIEYMQPTPAGLSLFDDVPRFAGPVAPATRRVA